VIRLLRRLRLFPAATVSVEGAVDIARRECARRGWPWQEPIKVQHGFHEYLVMTNFKTRGGQVVIGVDYRTGDISRADFTRR
jgi:hypothetical protein